MLGISRIRALDMYGDSKEESSPAVLPGMGISRTVSCFRLRRMDKEATSSMMHSTVLVSMFPGTGIVCVSICQ